MQLYFTPQITAPQIPRSSQKSKRTGRNVHTPASRRTGDLPSPAHSRSRGFSLIELGLALAIIALIAGGVVKGRDMIANARLQNIVTQIGQFELAINSFESRYGALPGDMGNATVAFTGLPEGSNGNANDRIDTAAEAVRAFQVLGLAQLINGQFNGATFTGAQCPAATCPTTATGGRLEFLSDTSPSGGGSFRALLSPRGSLDIRQLAELDRKIDDGRANSGRFQLVANAPEACMTAGNWNIGSTAENCTAAIIIQ